jgi:thiol-disulfide isomerase/thioredoxin
LTVGVIAVATLLFIAGFVLLVRSGVNSTSNGTGAPPLPGNDFRIVAYQGEDVLGGHESQFSHVTGEGKPVVLNFFAGQCPPCRAEMPGFQRVSTEFAGKAIFVGVDIGPYLGLGSHADAQNLLGELKVTYPAAYAPDSSPLTKFQILGMPTTVIFDASGNLVERHTGILTEDQLRAKLRPLTAA